MDLIILDFPVPVTFLHWIVNSLRILYLRWYVSDHSMTMYKGRKGEKKGGSWGGGREGKKAGRQAGRK